MHRAQRAIGEALSSHGLTFLEKLGLGSWERLLILIGDDDSVATKAVFDL
jgi:hypothetical protein